MTYTGLVYRNLLRHRLRTLLTVLAIAVSILLVCAVLTLPTALNSLVDNAASNVRISVHHRAGLGYWLPVAFVARARQLKHVTAVNTFAWYGGVYDDPRNQFPSFAVDPDAVSAMWPEYGIEAEALERFRRVRNGALVGDQTMRRFDWKVGDNVTLRGKDFPVDLTFQVVGVIPAGANPVPDMFWFDRKYLDEALQRSAGIGIDGWSFVQIIWLRADGVEHVESIMSEAERLFRDSGEDIAVETEKSFIASFVNSSRGLVRVIVLVGGLVVTAVVLIAANTSAMGVRERIAEIAIMKSLGFRRRLVLSVLLAESVLQALAGGLLGTGLALALFAWLRGAGRANAAVVGPLGGFFISPEVVGEGILVALFVGFVAGAVPAWNGARVNVTAALRSLF